jgi:hypothetical protein
MVLSRLTFLSWGLVLLLYTIRAFYSLDPGTDLIWKDLFRGETGIIDRAEAVLWVPVILLSLVSFVRTMRRGGLTLTSLWYLGMAVMCVFLLGEEISWGQHIIGFESSEAMARINAQQESNIHNLNLALMLGVPETGRLYPWLTNFNHILNPAYYLLTCILFIGIPAAKRMMQWQLLESLPAPNGRTIAFLAANVVAYLVVDKMIGLDVGEIFEYALVTTFGLAALETYQHEKALDIAADAGARLSSSVIPSTVH